VGRLSQDADLPTCIDPAEQVEAGDMHKLPLLSAETDNIRRIILATAQVMKSTSSSPSSLSVIVKPLGVSWAVVKFQKSW
jgi:hypothetical protein